MDFILCKIVFSSVTKFGRKIRRFAKGGRSTGAETAGTPRSEGDDALRARGLTTQAIDGLAGRLHWS